MFDRCNRRHRISLTVALLAAGLMIGSGLFTSCGDDPLEPMASARVVTARADLIGGTRALGEIGDFVLENDQVRLIIQGPGYSRGFGVFGGSLIDADLRRPSERGNSAGGTGNDEFCELFPAFFLQAAAIDQVVIDSDGSDGGPARIISSGYGDDFLTMLGVLNRAGIGSHENYMDGESEPHVRYDIIYELHPGARHVDIRFQITNLTQGVLLWPGPEAETLLTMLGLDLEGFTIPIGQVLLFGKTSKAFAPGAGFDLRFALEDSYDNGVEFPAFPGLVTDWIASSSDSGVSYGLLASTENGGSYVYNKLDAYIEDADWITPTSLLMPFSASGFLGVFYGDAPAQLEPGETFGVTTHFVIGDGDIGSVLDEFNRIQDIPTGRLTGRVLDEISGQPAQDAMVLVYQRDGGTRRIYSQYDVYEQGHFAGTLAVGDYSLRVESEGGLGPFFDFTITAGGTISDLLTAPSAGRITATVLSPDGRRLPAKLTIVGQYDAERAGQETRDFLFDLQTGEHYRYSDMIPDDPTDPSTLRYIEAHVVTRNGFAEAHVRPGTYEYTISRGPEYDISTGVVTVGAGQTASIDATLHRVVDTTGWLSGDLHIHSINSIDASTPLDERVFRMAAEGIEWAVSTDHNYVTDFAPVIAQNGLQPWMISSIGIELSTLESGHFNGYPLEYQVGPITHGSFEWSDRPPDEIFDDMRALGAYGPDDTIIQVNHPRDTIIGYFNQYRREGLTFDYLPPGILDQFLMAEGPAFFDETGETTYSALFDAIEIFNGKRMELLHHYRVPADEDLPDGDIPANLPPAGTILLDSDGYDVEFPGVVDDYYNLLNNGERYIAVGASDTHQTTDDAGYARTMIYVGVDDPAAITDLEIVRAMHTRRVVTTNGPMVDFYINDPMWGAMGQTLRDDDGTVSITLNVTAAPWISVGRINIVRNGLIAHVLEVDETRDLAADPYEITIDVALATNDDDELIDTWFLVEVIGYESFFPVVMPTELPPLSLNDAIGSIAGPFGFGEGAYGDLGPAMRFPVSAYALTNPIWVTYGDEEFTPPGPIPYAIRSSADHDPGFAQNPFGRTFVAGPVNSDEIRYVGTATPIENDTVMVFQRDPNNPYDIRRVFDSLGRRE